MGTTLSMNTKYAKSIINGDGEIQKEFDNYLTRLCNACARALDKTHRIIYKRGVNLWYGGNAIDGKPLDATFKTSVTQHNGRVVIKSIATPTPYKTPGLVRWMDVHLNTQLNETNPPSGASTWDDFDTLKLHYAFDEGFTGLPKIFRHKPQGGAKGFYSGGIQYWYNPNFKMGRNGINLYDYLINDYYVKQAKKVFNKNFNFKG